MPDCTAQPTECQLVTELNKLDGFALQPRIRVSFSGPINQDTLRSGIVFVWLDSLSTVEQGQGPIGRLSTINQVVYDPSTNTAYAKPDDFFDQQRHYAIIVTDAVLDSTGAPVVPDPNFTACMQSPQNAYCTALAQIVQNLGGIALPGNIVSASYFTTLSATSWLEMARDLLPKAPLHFQSTGASVVAANILSFGIKGQVTVSPATFQTVGLKTPTGTFAGVDRLVFGSYESPNFLTDTKYIPYTPTANSVALPSATNTIQFHAYVPSSPMPAAGYPVIIFGHSLGGDSVVSPTLVSSTFARAGFVTLAINAVGHGFGPQSIIALDVSNKAVEFPGGGRGVDLNGDGVIDDDEGCVLSWPFPVGTRDCIRQTVVDMMQLANLVHSGTAIEPSTNLKLDGNRIYYAGWSMGGEDGVVLHAVDPAVRALASSVGGGSSTQTDEWSPTFSTDETAFIAGYLPSLLNAGTGFNADDVLRNQPAYVSMVPGAVDIQNMLGEVEWLRSSGDPLSFAPHLNLTPLANMQPKPALFLYDVGDQTIPNPEHSNLIRSAGAFQSSTLYRADLAGPIAAAICCTLPADSHPFLNDSTNAATLAIAGAAQQQIAGFFASDGATIPDANAALATLVPQVKPLLAKTPIFETPGHDIESLNFGTLGISTQQNLTLDQTPTIEKIWSAAGTTASVQPNVQPGTPIAIYGTNLASNTAADATLPSAIAGVNVTIGGEAAALYFVSPAQIQAIVPPDLNSGPVQVVVTTGNGTTSGTFNAQISTLAPAFLVSGAKYALLTQPTDMIFVAALESQPDPAPVNPGDTVTLWSTGFGPVAQDGSNTVTSAVTISVGGLPATIVSAVSFPALPGLYQITIQVPGPLPAGDALLQASVGGLPAPGNVYLPIAAQPQQ